MEWINALWITTLLPVLSTYGITLLVLIGVVLVVALFAALIYVTPSVASYLKALAEKNLSEKVSQRVNDALSKLETVIIEMLQCQQEELKKMAKEAMSNDGVIDSNEIKAMAKKLGSIAVERITPDINTFKKYITGGALTDYVEQKISAIINQSVNSILEKQFGKK